MRISDWSSDVCSSDLAGADSAADARRRARRAAWLRSAALGQPRHPHQDRHPGAGRAAGRLQPASCVAASPQRAARLRQLLPLAPRRYLPLPALLLPSCSSLLPSAFSPPFLVFPSLRFPLSLPTSV